MINFLALTKLFLRVVADPIRKIICMFGTLFILDPR